MCSYAMVVFAGKGRNFVLKVAISKVFLKSLLFEIWLYLTSLSIQLFGKITLNKILNITGAFFKQNSTQYVLLTLIYDMDNYN